MANARTWWFRVYNVWSGNLDRQLRIRTTDPRKSPKFVVFYAH